MCVCVCASRSLGLNERGSERHDIMNDKKQKGLSAVKYKLKDTSKVQILKL